MLVKKTKIKFHSSDSEQAKQIPIAIGTNSKMRTIIFGICFLFFGISSYAQCAMCRASLAGEGNKTQAQAVNDGIVYLMVIPYLLVAGIGYAIYRMKKKK